MKFGLPFSILLHTGFAFGGLLLVGNSVQTFDTVQILPLEIVTVSEVTNLKPQQQRPEPEKPEPEILTPEPQIDPAPQPSPETQTPDSESKPTPPPAKPAAPAFDLDAFSDLIKTERETNPNANTQTQLENERAFAEMSEHSIRAEGDGTGLTIDQEAYIREKSRQCYQVDRGAKDYKQFRVELRLNLDIDGKISDVDLLNAAEIIASGNASWNAHAQSLISELQGCPPFKDLPRAAYDEWKSLKLNFQPEG